MGWLAHRLIGGTGTRQGLRVAPAWRRAAASCSVVYSASGLQHTCRRRFTRSAAAGGGHAGTPGLPGTA
eukprot:scaffold19803_cov64-Phaeocystis_antarctica.AAC.5